MTEEEVISIAVAAITKSGDRIGEGPIHAVPGGRHMNLGRSRTGWVVWIPLDVPKSFEPNNVRVEVYEPDGEVFIPMNI